MTKSHDTGEAHSETLEITQESIEALRQQLIGLTEFSPELSYTSDYALNIYEQVSRLKVFRKESELQVFPERSTLYEVVAHTSEDLDRPFQASISKGDLHGGQLSKTFSVNVNRETNTMYLSYTESGPGHIRRKAVDGDIPPDALAKLPIWVEEIEERTASDD